MPRGRGAELLAEKIALSALNVCLKLPSENAMQLDSIRTLNKNSLGSRIRLERKQRGWTLAELSAATGITSSALSKAENGKIALGYENLRRVAEGFGIEVGKLFEVRENLAAARRSHSRMKDAATIEIPGYHLRYLARDLIKKRFVPMVVTVNARTLEEAGGLKHHDGDEVYFVVSGAATLHTSVYAPLTVSEGECVYMDGRTPHAFIKHGRKPATIFSVNEGYPVFSTETGEICLDESVRQIEIGHTVSERRLRPKRGRKSSRR